MAWIDWWGLHEQLQGDANTHEALAGASTSAVDVLRIATSLVTDHEVALGQVLGGLDARNTSLVARAVVDAYGHRRRVTIAVILPPTVPPGLVLDPATRRQRDGRAR